LFAFFNWFMFFNCIFQCFPFFFLSNIAVNKDIYNFTHNNEKTRHSLNTKLCEIEMN